MPLPPGKVAYTGKDQETWQQKLPSHLKALRAEIEKRPWQGETRHTGDDALHSEIHRAARVGGPALGTPVEKMPIHFYFPAVQIRCGHCKRDSIFSAHASSTPYSMHNLFPRNGDNGIEQMFQPVFRCEACRKVTHTALIHRVGLRLHLCGFAPRRERFASRTVPDLLVPILSDAEQAVAEGDLFAGFYHLRTLLEHYLKYRLGIPLADQLRGEELIEKHHTSLPVEWRAILPSATEAFSGLSERLHARTGTADDFKMLRDKICNHLDMVALMERQMPRQ